MFGFFDYESLANQSLAKRSTYKNKSPFSYAVINGEVSPQLLKKVAKEFDIPSAWHRYDNAFEKKEARDNFEDLPHFTKMLLSEMNSVQFIRFLESLTGVESLITDHTFRGAGMHQIRNGGKLDVHVDFNWHPKLKLKRAVNVLLYLNEAWLYEWGGYLQLWNQDMSACHTLISPLFNNMVIFNSTETSFHGHPNPVQAPEGITRKSIAVYYYVSTGEYEAPHSTKFVPRPGDVTDPEIEDFRERRSTFQNYGKKESDR